MTSLHTDPPSDRYVVVSRLEDDGAYARWSAYDRLLRRPVVLLEVDRSKLGAATAQHIVHRAKALATVSDSRVAAVYDIEHPSDERYVLVMEHVGDVSLAAWVEDAGDHWNEILLRFIDAGRGLAAAHRAGLVHGKFSASQVRIGKELRQVKVTGLVAGPEPSDTASVAEAAEHASWPAPDGHEVPSPETDIVDFREAASAALRRCVVDPPPRSVLALLRHEPRDTVQQKWRGLGGLCDALEDARTHQRRMRQRVTVLALVAVPLLVGWMSFGARHGPDCLSAAQQLDRVWNEARRDELASGMAAMNEVGVGKIAQQASEALDDYAAAWAAVYRETCDAGQITVADAPKAAFACLRRAQLGFEATVDALVEPDRKILTQIDTILAHLPAPDECRGQDPLAVALPLAPPDSAAAIDEIERILARADVWKIAGRYDELAGSLEVAERRLQGVSYEPLLADVASMRGAVANARTDFVAAHFWCNQAFALALRSRHWKRVRHVGLQLASLLVREGRLAEAESYLGMAVGLGGEGAIAQSGIARVEAQLLSARREHADAARILAQDVERLRGHFGHDNFMVAMALQDLAVQYIQNKDFEAAEDAILEAQALFDHYPLPNHPVRVVVLSTFAGLLSAQKKPVEAAKAYAKAIEVAENSPEPPAVLLGTLRFNLSVALVEQGDLEGGLRVSKLAMAAVKELLGEKVLVAPSVWGHAGSILWALGRQDEAEALYREVLAVTEEPQGPGPWQTAVLTLRNRFAWVLMEQGKLAEAEALLRGQVQNCAQTQHCEPPHAVATLRGALAIVLIRRGRLKEARDEAEQAWEILEQPGASPGSGVVARAVTAFALAQVLWLDGGDSAGARRRALALAGEAQQGFEAAGALHRGQAEAVRAWLRKSGHRKR